MEEGMRHDVTEQERANPGMDAPHTDNIWKRWKFF